MSRVKVGSDRADAGDGGIRGFQGTRRCYAPGFLARTYPV